MNIALAIEAIRLGTYDETLKKLYPRYDSDPEKYKNRIYSLLSAYKEHFPEPAETSVNSVSNWMPSILPLASMPPCCLMW